MEEQDETHGSRRDLLLSDWDMEREIGVIDWTPGWGKTHLSLDTGEGGLISAINDELTRRDPNAKQLKARDVLYLTSRRAILDQQDIAWDSLEKVKTLDELANAFDEVWGMTYHRLGSRLSLSESVPDGIRLVICDEAHSLFTDTYAESLHIVKEWLARSHAIRVFLTATPEPLYYLNGKRARCQRECTKQFGFKFRTIARHEPIKYKHDSIRVVTGAMPSTLVRRCHGKTLVFVYSAREAYRLSQETQRSMFVISKSSDKKAKDGTPLADLMDREKIACLVETGLFPSGIDTIFATSTFREGVDLHEHIDNAIIQGTEAHDIVQCLGRCRTSIPNVIVCGEHTESRQKKTLLQAKRLLDRYDACKSDAERQVTLASSAGKENQLTYVGIDGTYKIDWSVICIYLYKWDCYLASTDYNDEGTNFMGESIPTRTDYYKGILGIYTDRLFFSDWTKLDTTESLMAERKARIQDAVRGYVGVKVFSKSDEESALLDLVKPIDRHGNAKGATVLWRWIEEQTHVTKGQCDDGNGRRRRYHVIEAQKA